MSIKIQGCPKNKDTDTGISAKDKNNNTGLE